MKRKKIVFIRTNLFSLEPRLNKEVAAAEKKYSCYIISWDRELTGQKNKNLYSFNVYAKLGGKLYFVMFPIWTVYCFFCLLKIRPDIVHACDSEGVLSGLLYVKIFRKKIIYDMWDATSCRIPQGNILLDRLARWLDKQLINVTDVLIIPDQERLTQVGVKNDAILKKTSVIYNSNVINVRDLLSMSFVDYKKIDVVYIGTLVLLNRGLEQIISVSSFFPNINFHIYGYGPDSEKIKELISSRGVSNLFLHGRVGCTEAEEINNNSDLIISLLNPKFENYQYATSTKVFDAFSSYKPIITTRGTASGKLVDETGWGVSVAYNENALKNTLFDIVNGNICFSLDYRRIEKYDWRVMIEKLVAIYDSLVC